MENAAVLREWFDRVDSEKTGSIAAAQLKSAFAVPFSVVQQMIRMYDFDRNGTMSFEGVLDILFLTTFMRHGLKLAFLWTPMLFTQFDRSLFNSFDTAKQGRITLDLNQFVFCNTVGLEQVYKVCPPVCTDHLYSGRQPMYELLEAARSYQSGPHMARNDVTCDKNFALAHKPNLGLVTEQVVSKQKHFPKVISTKPNTLAENFTVANVEEFEDDSNVTVTMFVRYTKAFLDDIDRMILLQLIPIEKFI